MKISSLYHSLIISAGISSCLLISTVSANPFNHTGGYQSLNHWAIQLQGQRQVPRGYCQRYAQVANSQARRRTQSHCTNNIPLNSWNIRKRWTINYTGHYNWCRSVSSYSSGNETRSREYRLKSCIIANQRLTIVKCRHNDKVHKAAARGDINYVRRCLNIGFPVNSREHNNWTPLHSAARSGQYNVVQLLVNRRAAINAKDRHQRTPLDQARLSGRQSVINYLMRRGAY
ncbi:MAG: ankyrin repeat domain-containing protein [Thiotrichaceae bacterium]|nr:ankyrin repeat domain-containing protein [Thiotrichaceae bacterium]